MSCRLQRRLASGEVQVVKVVRQHQQGSASTRRVQPYRCTGIPKRNVAGCVLLHRRHTPPLQIARHCTGQLLAAYLLATNRSNECYNTLALPTERLS